MMLTNAPPPLATMIGTAWHADRHTAVTLESNVRPHPASV